MIKQFNHGGKEWTVELPDSVLTKSQTLVKKATRGKLDLVAVLRYDDQCGNGHNSFSLTGNLFDRSLRRKDKRVTCGCIHDTISGMLPSLAPLIPWHLTSSDGPVHYLANTIYHASDRDHNDLRLGETRQIVSGHSGLPCWILRDVGLPRYVDSATRPIDSTVIGYEPWLRTGEGKPRDFDAARSSAVWPEATDEQLSLPPLELASLLVDRLPTLMLKFKSEMENLGFTY